MQELLFYLKEGVVEGFLGWVAKDNLLFLFLIIWFDD